MTDLQNKQESDLEPNPRDRWLAPLSIAVLVLTIIVRLIFAVEIPAGVAYETEAAYRIVMGQSPYNDFYFDHFPPIIIWRMLGLALAQLLALASGLSPALGECFFNPRLIGLASVFITSITAIFSFVISFVIIDRYGRQVFTGHLKWLLLAALALGNLAMGFEYGEQQHLFILLATPYFVLRIIENHSGDSDQIYPLPGARLRLMTACFAALGAAFNPLYLFVILAWEAVEYIARNGKNGRGIFPLATIAFVLVSVLLWLNLLILPKDAARCLFTWILPLKFNALTHDSYAIYGNIVTPERKTLLYAAVLAVILAFGNLRRLPLLRPLASLVLLGLMVWMTLVLGLSADACILTYFTTTLFAVEIFQTAAWFVARYPRLFLRKKEMAIAVLYTLSICGICALLIGGEIYQRRLVRTGPIRLTTPLTGKLPDLADVVKINAPPRSGVMILNGKLRPTFPLLAVTGRSTCGYFLGTEVLGTLSNIRTRHYAEPAFGTPGQLCMAAELDLYTRLARDIRELKPELICVESGEIEEALALYKVQALILERYERLGEAQYYSDRIGPREITDVNYNYWVYKLKVAK